MMPERCGESRRLQSTSTAASDEATRWRTVGRAPTAMDRQVPVPVPLDPARAKPSGLSDQMGAALKVPDS